MGLAVRFPAPMGHVVSRARKDISASNKRDRKRIGHRCSEPTESTRWSPAGVRACVREFVSLLVAVQARVERLIVEEFYFLARATLVKDEKNFYRFVKAFAQLFKGI